MAFNVETILIVIEAVKVGVYRPTQGQHSPEHVCGTMGSAVKYSMCPPGKLSRRSGCSGYSVSTGEGGGGRGVLEMKGGSLECIFVLPTVLADVPQ